MLDKAIFQGGKFCVVGNICRDVKMAPIEADERIFRDGETPTEFIVETIGGGGANSALFAAALGASARFAGKVGDDPLGARLEQAMIERGVASFIRRDPTIRTGSSLVLNFTNGCRHFVSYQENSYTFCFDDVAPDVFADGGHLLRADVWFSEPMLAGGNAKLLQTAKQNGLATSLDLNWDPCWGSAPAEAIKQRKQAVRDVLPLVDLVHGNVRELNLFADSDDLTTTLQRLIAWGAGAVVVHMGAKGAGYFCNDRLLVEPSVPVQRHVNATGCGDLLSACMMLLHGRSDIPLGEQLQLSNRIVAGFIEGEFEVLSLL